MKKISVLVGSLSEDSINMKLAKLIVQRFDGKIEFEFIDLALFPFYSSQAQANYPAEIAEIKEQIATSDGVMVVTPEYNRSVPGVLKNALDWISRPGDARNPFLKQQVAILGVSPGKIGTSLAQRHLREVLAFFGANIFHREAYLTAGEIFEGDGLSKSGQEFIDNYLAEFFDEI